jgi:hypothetical protein
MQFNIINKILNYYKKLWFGVSLMLYNVMVYAADTAGIAGIDDMISSGQKLLMVCAKWGGITTVVGAALALGRGRLEGALAQTVCKILIVVGLLIAAFGFFKEQLAFGFSF